jgi:hypothetical protein
MKGGSQFASNPANALLRKDFQHAFMKHLEPTSEVKISPNLKPDIAIPTGLNGYPIWVLWTRLALTNFSEYAAYFRKMFTKAFRKSPFVSLSCFYHPINPIIQKSTSIL